MEEYMTTKELAKAAGVSVRTIQKAAKKLYYKKIKERQKSLFETRECINILKNIKKKNKVMYGSIEI